MHAVARAAVCPPFGDRADDVASVDRGSGRDHVYQRLQAGPETVGMLDCHHPPVHHGAAERHDSVGRSSHRCRDRCREVDAAVARRPTVRRSLEPSHDDVIHG